MKRSIYGILWLICLVVSTAFGRTIYVDIGSTNPVQPYVDWTTAATNIPAAVNAAVKGDVVLVEAGQYQVSGQVEIDKGIAVRSVAGPAETIVKRRGPLDKQPFHRLFFLADPHAVVDGFTISGGYVTTNRFGNGGGVYISTNGGMVCNCVILSNYACFGSGGGVFCEPGGVVRGCTISGNGAHYSGGIYCEDGLVEGCVISDNTCNREGGGATCNEEAVMRNCVVTRNSAELGGGVFCKNGTIENCLVVSNCAGWGNGGGVLFRSGLIQNCTIVQNRAKGGGGGVSGCDVMRDTIVMFNSCGGGGDWMNLGSIGSDSEISHCCIDPAPAGVGNFSKNPLFVDFENGDFHLQKDSPCIDAGDKTDAPDTGLDGNARPADGNRDGTAEFDIGAYEFRP